MSSKARIKAEIDLTTHQLPSDDGAFLGGCAITTVLFCMSVGPLVPGILLVLACYGYIKTATTLAAGVLASMATARHSPAWCSFFLKAACYLKGGVYLHIEQRAIDALSKSPAMWCMHPHGTSIGLGFTLNGAIRFRAEDEERFVPKELVVRIHTDRLRRADGVQAPILFYVPLIRSMLLGFGCCTPATKRNMHELFRKRVDFGILPGGMEEVALYQHGRERVFISSRAGFIKYALQHGYLLLPGYTFGESDLYQSMTRGSTIRMWMQQRLGFIVPIFWGPLWYAPWLPARDVAIHTVMGAPLQLPRIESPTEAQVIEWHGRYVASLRELFDTHKEQFGYGDRELEC